MATAPRPTRSTRSQPRGARRPLEGLYPPGQPPEPHHRGVLDDTLDAHPPYHLLRGRPTPEAIEAARQLAAEYGYPPPRFPPDDEAAPASGARPVNGARANRSKRTAGANKAPKK